MLLFIVKIDIVGMLPNCITTFMRSYVEITIAPDHQMGLN